MKRIFIFIVTNLAVLLTLGIVANVICRVLYGTNIEQILGPQWTHLLVYGLVYGMLGAFVSLLLSKPIAKFSTGARTIDGSEGEPERWLVATVEDLARQAGVRTPEVAIYEGAANAFATGAFKNRALVAVSTGIMRQMTKEELRAVLGHEMSHVANGDMVTLTLIQGVLNAFVIVVSRAIAWAIANASDKGERRRGGDGIYFLLVMALQVLLGILASLVVMWFSRRREYAADAGSARLLGTPSPMIAALRRLGNLVPGTLPDSLGAMGIASGRKTSIWSTHPAIEDRIAALQNAGLA